MGMTFLCLLGLQVACLSRGQACGPAWALGSAAWPRGTPCIGRACLACPSWLQIAVLHQRLSDGKAEQERLLSQLKLVEAERKTQALKVCVCALRAHRGVHPQACVLLVHTAVYLESNRANTHQCHNLCWPASQAACLTCLFGCALKVPGPMLQVSELTNELDNSQFLLAEAQAKLQVQSLAAAA